MKQNFLLQRRLCSRLFSFDLFENFFYLRCNKIELKRFSWIFCLKENGRWVFWIFMEILKWWWMVDDPEEIHEKSKVWFLEEKFNDKISNYPISQNSPGAKNKEVVKIGNRNFPRIFPRLLSGPRLMTPIKN